MSERLNRLYRFADKYERWEMDNPALDVDVADILFLIQAVRDINQDQTQMWVPSSERWTAIKLRATAYTRWMKEGYDIPANKLDVLYLTRVLEMVSTLRIGVTAMSMEAEMEDGNGSA